MAINFLFDILAPIYDRIISQPDAGLLRDLLDLPENSIVLDAGGGTGRVSSQLLPFIDKLVLSDLSFPMLREAQGKGISRLVQGTSRQFPFQDEAFDRILVVDALHHFSDQPAAVKDLLRILKPGGRLVIEEPDIRKFQVKLIAFMEKLLMMRSYFHKPEEIKKMAEACGGSAQVELDGEFTAWVVVEK